MVTVLYTKVGAFYRKGIKENFVLLNKLFHGIILTLNKTKRT